MSQPDTPEPDANARGEVDDAALDEARIDVYHRLMAAQDRIAHARYARGVDHATVEAALDASETGPTAAERREDLYMSALAHYVASLGGRLELRAVFADDTVTIDPGERG